ncbi:hypothetical protein [Bosea sp. (in: a-proteobacteria)]
MRLASACQPSPEPATRDVVARMAAFMIDIAASAGAATRDDLLLEFTPEEIDAHNEAARRMALAEAGLGGARQ